MIAPVEGLDALEELRLGIDPVHAEGGQPTQPRPLDEAGIDPVVLRNVLVAEVQSDLPVVVDVLQAQGVTVWPPAFSGILGK